MAFDRDAFLAAFLNQMSAGIAENRTKAEEYKEKQEAAYERNQALVQQRDMRAKRAAELGKQALQYLPEGADAKAMVRTAMASGMTGISEFLTKIQAAHANAGLAAGQRLSVQDVEAVVNMPNIPLVDTSLIDMSLEEFARQTFGASAKAAPVEDKSNMLGKLFGFGAKERVMKQLRETPAYGDMSVADVNAAALQSEFNQLSPESVMSLSDIEMFSKKMGFAFADELSTEYQNATKDRYADDHVARRVQQFIDKWVTPVAEGGLGKAEADISPDQLKQVRDAARIEYAQGRILPIIQNNARQYGGVEGFFRNEAAMAAIEELMGAKYLKDLKKKYDIEDDEEPDVTEDTETDDTITDDIETDDTITDDTETEDPIEPEQPETPTAPPLPQDKLRPTSLDESISNPALGGATSLKAIQRIWDKKYGARYNADGTPIIVEKRPDETEVRKVKRGKVTRTISLASEWDKKYAETHNPDGTPKKFEDD